jgi:hypothetical protein
MRQLAKLMVSKLVKGALAPARAAGLTLGQATMIVPTWANFVPNWGYKRSKTVGTAGFEPATP